MTDLWIQEGDRYSFGGITAERVADDAFVITSFGSQRDAERAFVAIQAAMIRLRVTPQTKATIDTLIGDGWIKCARTVGTEQQEVGVMGVRRK